MFDSSVNLICTCYNSITFCWVFLFSGLWKTIAAEFLLGTALQIHNFPRIYFFPSSNVVEYYTAAGEIDIGMAYGCWIEDSFLGNVTSLHTE